MGGLKQLGRILERQRVVGSQIDASGKVQLSSELLGAERFEFLFNPGMHGVVPHRFFEDAFLQVWKDLTFERACCPRQVCCCLW